MKNSKEKKPNMWLALLRAALTASALSVLLTVIFAFVLQKRWLGLDSVRFINAGVKVLSAVAAALIAVRASSSRAPLWGALAGGAYMLMAFMIFSVLSGSFSPELGLLTDLAMCVLAGAATGILRNLRMARG